MKLMTPNVTACDCFANADPVRNSRRLIAGSFLNVVASPTARRVPRGSRVALSQLWEAIKPYDNLPVLGGCCSVADAIVPHGDLTSLPPCGGADGGARRGVVLVKHSPDLVLGLLLVAVLVPVALIDFDRRIIPNRITLPRAWCDRRRLVLAPSKVPEQLIAAPRGFVPARVRARYPRGMGWGRQARGCDRSLPRTFGSRSMVAAVPATVSSRGHRPRGSAGTQDACRSDLSSPRAVVGLLAGPRSPLVRGLRRVRVRRNPKPAVREKRPAERDALNPLKVPADQCSEPHGYGSKTIVG